MVANQTVCSRFEQRSVMKFLVAEKYKPCVIHMEKFKKIFINLLNIHLLQQAQVEKTVPTM